MFLSCERGSEGILYNTAAVCSTRLLNDSSVSLAIVTRVIILQNVPGCSIGGRHLCFECDAYGKLLFMKYINCQSAIFVDAPFGINSEVYQCTSVSVHQ